MGRPNIRALIKLHQRKLSLCALGLDRCDCELLPRDFNLPLCILPSPCRCRERYHRADQILPALEAAYKALDQISSRFSVRRFDHGLISHQPIVPIGKNATLGGNVEWNGT